MLEDNEAKYPLWQADPAYARNKAHFINTATDFRMLYGKQLSRYIFEIIRPILEEVETFAILPTIGQEQYDDLKQGIALKALTADEFALVQIIQRAVVHFTMQEALERHWVQFNGNRIVQIETLEPQGYEGKVPASVLDFWMRPTSMRKKRLAWGLISHCILWMSLLLNTVKMSINLKTLQHCWFQLAALRIVGCPTGWL